jgi:hypothetical protein
MSSGGQFVLSPDSSSASIKGRSRAELCPM